MTFSFSRYVDVVCVNQAFNGDSLQTQCTRDLRSFCPCHVILSMPPDAQKYRRYCKYDSQTVSATCQSSGVDRPLTLVATDIIFQNFRTFSNPDKKRPFPWSNEYKMSRSDIIASSRLTFYPSNIDVFSTCVELEPKYCFISSFTISITPGLFFKIF